jgi:hypothetical protein
LISTYTVDIQEKLRLLPLLTPLPARLLEHLAMLLLTHLLSSLLDQRGHIFSFVYT